MLDTHLIEIGTAQAQRVLTTLGSVKNTVKVFSQLLPDVLIKELVEYCNSVDWQDAENIQGNVIKHRKKALFKMDTVTEVVHCIFENATPIVGHLLNCKDIKFNGVVLWKDSQGYTIGPHTDNPIFKCSLQMYIQNLPMLSTVFETENDYDNNIWTDTMPGSGYIADNANGLTHWMNGIVPQDFNRYSLHAIWS